MYDEHQYQTACGDTKIPANVDSARLQIRGCQTRNHAALNPERDRSGADAECRYARSLS